MLSTPLSNGTRSPLKQNILSSPMNTGTYFKTIYDRVPWVLEHLLNKTCYRVQVGLNHLGLKQSALFIEHPLWDTCYRGRVSNGASRETNLSSMSIEIRDISWNTRDRVHWVLNTLTLCLFFYYVVYCLSTLRQSHHVSAVSVFREDNHITLN